VPKMLKLDWALAPALSGSRSASLRAACGSKGKTFLRFFGPAEAGP
jgi:hypothetical protein